MRLGRSDPTSLLDTVTSGAFTDGTLRFGFVPAGPGATACEVTAESVRYPGAGTGRADAS